MGLCQRPLVPGGREDKLQLCQAGGRLRLERGCLRAALAMTSPVCSGHDITRLHVLLALVRSVDAGAGTCQGGELALLGSLGSNDCPPAQGSMLCIQERSCIQELENWGWGNELVGDKEVAMSGLEVEIRCLGRWFCSCARLALWPFELVRVVLEPHTEDLLPVTCG